MFVVQKNPKSVEAEAYKVLRTNIQYSSFDKNAKVIVVTSSEPGEGKSTTTGNLGLSMAQDGKKTIIIDCDLRKPTIHKNFEISNTSGLSELIIGKINIEEATKEVNRNLKVITSGKIPPNPLEMLGSENMKKLLAKLKEHYDVIILDSPPILVVADAQVLSTLADGTVMVVRAGKTKKEMVLKAKKKVEQVHGKILGMLLNGAEKEAGNYYYYYGN